MTETLRLPQGWGSPHVFSVSFSPLCTPSNIAGPLGPELVAERANQEQDLLVLDLQDCSGCQTSPPLPQEPPVLMGAGRRAQLLPRAAEGTAQRELWPERGKVSTTPSPTLLLGFGHGGGPKCRPPGKAQHSGNVQHARQTGRLAAVMPAAVGQNLPNVDRASPPQLPSAYSPPCSHLSREGGEKLGYRQPPAVRGLAQPHPNQDGPAHQAHVTKPPRPQGGSKNTSSMKPPLTPQAYRETSPFSEPSSLSEGPHPCTLLHTRTYYRAPLRVLQTHLQPLAEAP